MQKVLKKMLQPAFSWAMAILQDKGDFSSFERSAKSKYVESGPDQCSAQRDDPPETNAIGESYIFGPIILSTLLIALALAVFIVIDVKSNSQKGRNDGSNDWLSFMRVPSLQERITGE